MQVHRCVSHGGGRLTLALAPRVLGSDSHSVRSLGGGPLAVLGAAGPLAVHLELNPEPLDLRGPSSSSTVLDSWCPGVCGPGHSEQQVRFTCKPACQPVGGGQHTLRTPLKVPRARRAWRSQELMSMVSSIGGGASVDGWYPTPGTGAAMSMVAASVPHRTELSSRAGHHSVVTSLEAIQGSHISDVEGGTSYADPSFFAHSVWGRLGCCLG